MSDPSIEPKLRADARRNRDAVLDAAGRLFADRGTAVQMEEIAEQSGLGMGTVYRHFPTKQALVAAIVSRRVALMTSAAVEAARLDDPGEAFEALLRGYLELASTDAAYRWSVLGPDSFDWNDVEDTKRSFTSASNDVIRRAVAAGYLRTDFTFRDFVSLTRAVMATMSPTAPDGWKRTLALIRDGIYQRS